MSVSEDMVTSLTDAKKGIERNARNLGINVIILGVTVIVLGALGAWNWVWLALGFDLVLGLTGGFHQIAGALVFQSAIASMRTLYAIEEQDRTARRRARIERAVTESRRPF